MSGTVEGGRKGGVIAATLSRKRGPGGRRVQAGKLREEKARDVKEDPLAPAPLPPVLCGDTSGLPKAPPGRRS